MKVIDKRDKEIAFEDLAIGDVFTIAEDDGVFMKTENIDTNMARYNTVDLLDGQMYNMSCEIVAKIDCELTLLR